MNPINIGEIHVCNEAVILPFVADVTGLWAFVSNFNGAYKYKQFQATSGEPIAVPVHLNESYTYTFKLFRPDETLFNNTGYLAKTIPMLADVEYDCPAQEGAGIVVTKTGKKQFVSGDGQVVFVSDLFKDAKYVMVFVEGALRQEGEGPEAYILDSEAGTVALNTPGIEGQNITILYFK